MGAGRNTADIWYLRVKVTIADDGSLVPSGRGKCSAGQRAIGTELLILLTHSVSGDCLQNEFILGLSLFLPHMAGSSLGVDTEGLI